MKWFLTGLALGGGLGLLYASRKSANTHDHAGVAEANTAKLSPELRNRLQPETGQSRSERQGESARDRAQQATHSRRTHIQSQTQQTESEPDVITVEFLTIINEWPHERLIEIDGIGPVLASRIIRNRPYATENDLIDAKLIPPAAIDALRKAS